MLEVTVDFSGDSGLNINSNASSLAGGISTAIGVSRVSSFAVVQESEITFEYDETATTASDVVRATEAIACASVTSRMCRASPSSQRRRSLAETLAVTITRELAAEELIGSVPAISSAGVAAELGLNSNAVTGGAAPVMKSLRLSVVLDSLAGQDAEQLRQASADLLGVDASTLVVTSVFQFPPRPPPGPPPGAPPVYSCANTCFFADDGVCNDGAAGSADATCAYASDCADCGNRVRVDSPPAPPPIRPFNNDGGQALSSSGRLSNVGWIVAIVVAVAVLAFCCIAIFYLRRKRKSRPVGPSYPAPPTTPTSAGGKPFSGPSGGRLSCSTSGGGPSGETSALRDSRLALERAREWQVGASQPLAQSREENFRIPARGRLGIRRGRTKVAPESKGLWARTDGKGAPLDVNCARVGDFEEGPAPPRAPPPASVAALLPLPSRAPGAGNSDAHRPSTQVSVDFRASAPSPLCDSALGDGASAASMYTTSTQAAGTSPAIRRPLQIAVGPASIYLGPSSTRSAPRLSPLGPSTRFTSNGSGTILDWVHRDSVDEPRMVSRAQGEGLRRLSEPARLPRVPLVWRQAPSPSVVGISSVPQRLDHRPAPVPVRSFTPTKEAPQGVGRL